MTKLEKYLRDYLAEHGSHARLTGLRRGEGYPDDRPIGLDEILDKYGGGDCLKCAELKHRLADFCREYDSLANELEATEKASHTPRPESP